MGRKTKMNSITSPELLAQVNPKNIQLMKDFLDYLRSVGRSEGTIDGYQNDLEIAWVWCLKNNDNKFFVDWTKRNIISYQNYLLNDNENSPARIRRLKAALSSLSGYIENILDDEFPAFRNIIHKIESPKNVPVREKTIITEEDLDLLLDTLINRGKYEKACFAALAAFGGRRKSEILRFKVSDFADDKLVCDGALYKSSPILTKGNKYLECYTLAKKFKPYFDYWMVYRKDNGIESEWLFPEISNPEEHITVNRINSWMDTFSSIIGKDIYAHAFRHMYVSYLSRSGIPDGIIVDIVGWTSSEMFKIYNDNPKDDQIGMYFKDGDISVPDKKTFSDI